MNVVTTETLISLIHQRPAVWDKRSKEHSNRFCVDKCWKEISKIMNVPEFRLRKKWKYLRDQFCSELCRLKTSKSGDAPGEVECKWQYFNSLLFLKDIVKSRVSNGKSSSLASHGGGGGGDDEDDTVSDNIESPNFNIVASHNFEIDSENSAEIMQATTQDNFSHLEVFVEPLPRVAVTTTPFTPATIPKSAAVPPSFNSAIQSSDLLRISNPVSLSKRLDLEEILSPNQSISGKRKRKESDDYHSTMLDIQERMLDIVAQKNTEKNRVKNDEDDDVLFFKSLLPYVKEIPRRQKLTFRRKVEDLVDKFAFSNRVQYSDSE